MDAQAFRTSGAIIDYVVTEIERGYLREPGWFASLARETQLALLEHWLRRK